VKKLLLALLLFSSVPALAQDKAPATLRSILLEQLRSTHNTNDWFVSPSKAVEGLTAEQASWTDGKGNHSIGQLAYHLVFWNSRNLARFKGQTPPRFSGNNDETFDKFDEKTWADTVKQLDQVMTDIERFVESADDATVAKFASAIAHIGTHNAYHTGQILYIRKENGWWDSSKGVK
jgi:uncharacterized damage-inducible protein DinB